MVRVAGGQPDRSFFLVLSWRYNLMSRLPAFCRPRGDECLLKGGHRPIEREFRYVERSKAFRDIQVDQ